MNPFWLEDDEVMTSYRDSQPHFEKANSITRNPELFIEYLDQQAIDIQ